MEDFGLVAEPHALQALLKRMAVADRIAFDTEFVPEYTYTPELCLIQVATPDLAAAVDTRTDLDLRPFWELLVAPGRAVVVHAGKEEMNFCKAATGRSTPSPPAAAAAAPKRLPSAAPLSRGSVRTALISSLKPMQPRG